MTYEARNRATGEDETFETLSELLERYGADGYLRDNEVQFSDGRVIITLTKRSEYERHGYLVRGSLIVPRDAIEYAE